MPVVLLVRGLLILPFLLGANGSGSYRNVLYTVGMVVSIAQAVNAMGVNTLQGVWYELFRHPAVRALGQDAVIATIGGSIYEQFR